MSSLEYSDDALNAKDAFYRSTAMVYVEGDDDVLFWEEVLRQTAGLSFVVEQVGGCGELDKYIAKIESGAVRALVGRDADLNVYLGARSASPRVMYTYGYSMENTLYTVSTLHALVKLWSKSSKPAIGSCDEWLKNVAITFAPLVHLDVTNATSSAGVETVGDNCTRFMTSQSSATPCPTKVATHSTAVSAKLPAPMLKAAESAVGSNRELVLNLLRGHFLASAVLKYVAVTAKAYGKKVSISAESLYAAALAHFAHAFVPTHPHFTHYKTEASAAIVTLY